LVLTALWTAGGDARVMETARLMAASAMAIDANAKKGGFSSL